MILFVVPALAAPLEVVLEGSVTSGSIEGVDVTSELIEAVITVDDTVVANENGIFDYSFSSPEVVLSIPALGEDIVLDAGWNSLLAAYTGNGFVVALAIYGGGIGADLGETYVSEPADDFSNATLYPYGAHALLDDDEGLLNPLTSFTGAVSANPYVPDGEVVLSFERVHVRTPDFLENAIEASYGADILDESFSIGRRPSTLQGNIDTLDAAATDAGCFADVGDPFGGAYNGPSLVGDGMLGESVSATNSGRSFSGTVGGLSLDGIQNSQGRVLAVDGNGELIAGHHLRIAGKRGIWYGIRVTGGCTASDLEAWYGESTAGL